MSNPFLDLVTSGFISHGAMQLYVVAMFLFVIGGTLLDVMHKKSAQYFFENAEKAKKSATRTISSGEKTSLIVKTVTNEVLTSSEFSNPQRRMSHLLTMYGFITFVATTAIMIFSLTDAGIITLLWHLGALSLAVGGYWFWFVIRADVSAEGNPWYKVNRADMFIVSLLVMSTFALLWSITGGSLFFFIFIAASTFLFTTVLWSKFAHMFFKPAAAFQKRVTKADGSRENLPGDFDLSSAEVQSKFPDIPEYMGKNPENMGLGIKREEPRHY
ncbi:MAG: hypothetical protein KAH03_07260 [Cocleimonas sp.]|nr:hypothetical protein [Cocleimonas sp.]